ncbi:unnamed protein product, partial [Echinostoma caproni]|uniref:Uncharacterized protein n=1 Tax=Echinostoma caproni TaxID=27848 RepID=A0A183BG79_9TREM
MQLLPTLSDAASPGTHAFLKPDFMLKLYRAASRCAPSESTSGMDLSDHSVWLRSVFANPESPCILVLCPDVDEPRSQSTRTKRARSDNPVSHSSGAKMHTPICPVCAEKQTSSRPVASGSKRRSRSGSISESSSPVYHLIKPNQVCWVRSRLPDPPMDTSSGRLESNEEDGEDDEDEDDDRDSVNPHADQCVLQPTVTSDHSTPVLVDRASTRVFALSDCYGAEHRSFFVDILGVPFTSSLDEVLSLRPQVKAVRDGQVTWSLKQWCYFGRRLGQWYALLDHWLLLLTGPCVPPTQAHPTVLSSNSHSASRSNPPSQNETRYAALRKIFEFPLLLAANGQWYRPSD